MSAVGGVIAAASGLAEMGQVYRRCRARQGKSAPRAHAWLEFGVLQAPQKWWCGHRRAESLCREPSLPSATMGRCASSLRMGTREVLRQGGTAGQVVASGDRD